MDLGLLSLPVDDGSDLVVGVLEDVLVDHGIEDVSWMRLRTGRDDAVRRAGARD